MHELALSARAYNKILKVARTISDIEGSDDIQVEHVSEAIQSRNLAGATDGLVFRALGRIQCTHFT